MEIEKFKVLIQFLLVFRRSGDVLFHHYAHRLRGYTATSVEKFDQANPVCKCSTFVKSLLVAPWSLTLAGLKLAGANSKPHDYKQRYKKLRPFRKRVSRKNRLRISDEKNFYSSLHQTTPWHTRPLNARIEIKTVEIGKTRTKNANTDMFNFYVVLAGCDTAGLPRAGENSKPHHCRKSAKTKIAEHSENMGFNGKTVWRFQTKKKQKH